MQTPLQRQAPAGTKLQALPFAGNHVASIVSGVGKRLEKGTFEGWGCAKPLNFPKPNLHHQYKPHTVHLYKDKYL